MIHGPGTVFVLGAGFTKAFLREAPLLIDDYGAEALKAKFGAFRDAVALLELELELTLKEKYPAGWINLERLMTRLAGGMPYDFVAEPKQPIAANHELDYLL